ncbi:MAG: hypothetical protein K6U87_06900 [Firmicutes bacterium]|nr:hypothetical protein [Bacillota bacterium]
MMAMLLWLAPALAWQSLAHEAGHVAAAWLCGARSVRLAWTRGRRGLGRWMVSPCARVDWDGPLARRRVRIVAAAGTLGAAVGCWGLCVVRALPAALRGDLLLLPLADLLVNWLVGGALSPALGLAADVTVWREGGAADDG